MKKISLLLLILIYNFSFSQSKTISGIIKDITSLQPVESVSIGISNSNLGTISNEDGKFRITLPANSNKIEFSHLLYNFETYAVKQNDTEVEIFLTPKSFKLDEVVINHKPGKELLTAAIDASKNKLEKSIVLNTYYREFVNVDNKYTSFSDGLVDFYVKRKSGASDVEVKQSRVFDLKDENASEREQAIQMVNLNDIRDAVTNAYNFKGLSKILKDDSYNYGVETKTEENGNGIEVVTFQPKDGIEEEQLYEGSVTYDAKTKLILDIDMRFSPAYKKFNTVHNLLIAKAKFNDFVRKSKFKLDGDKYVMVYNQIKINIYIKFGKMINNTFESTYDMTVLDYKEGEFELFKSRKYRERSLFDNGNKYTEEFWKKYNVVLLSDAEEKIINSLK
ncbi:carboxypeptidase-like regulatory domain-containing protein [Flavobacterium wongokense]|uniref:carboxypeptidase-like regulatory domain-containing protein n=1 Tax=Flavobacterium wongokense TaxID=2910674 RepID=UPI001F31415F|nr:carboxypeptidase-like regulatory domain-containing protein [Flavobacterium sp. WG47]MCF6131373.1 carboxypeptidase-like regulatory domain-containing protein [Flavobacterium sp. WG47]